jgi:hypothetical protein
MSSASLRLCVEKWFEWFLSIAWVVNPFSYVSTSPSWLDNRPVDDYLPRG